MSSSLVRVSSSVQFLMLGKKDGVEESFFLLLVSLKVYDAVFPLRENRNFHSLVTLGYAHDRV